VGRCCWARAGREVGGVVDGLAGVRRGWRVLNLALLCRERTSQASKRNGNTGHRTKTGIQCCNNRCNPLALLDALNF
jgi:hypothetical protein